MQTVAIVVSLVLSAITFPIIGKAVWDILSVIRAGQPAPGRTGNPIGRTVTMLKETLGHTRMLQWTWVGILHWFAFAAFIVLSTAVGGAYFQLFDPEWTIPVIGKFFAYEWVAEGLGLLGALAIIPLIVYRVRNRPSTKGRQSRFFGSTMWQAFFVEAMVLLESIAILFIRGAEYNLAKAHGGEHAEHATGLHFPISQAFGNLYPTGHDNIATLENIIFAIAMFKICSALIWLLVIARNLTMGIAWHRFTAWFNIWFKRKENGGTALGGLLPIRVAGETVTIENLEDLDEDAFEKLGVGKVEDFSWKDLLDFTTCTECGRCQSQCPAWNTEKPLSPKLLIMGLREHAYDRIPALAVDEEVRTEEQVALLERPLIGDESVFGVIDPDVLWSCTNCGACVQQCPVDIEHVDHIDDMRRYQVLVESNFPTELNNIFKGLERKGNPWGMNPNDRLKWTDGLDFEVKQVGVDVENLDEVDWLFWVGCAGAYEDRAKKTTQAVATLLDIAGVDFAVLGDGETCTGDPARRAGNEIVFMQLAAQNAEVFKETNVKKVVSTCAHCFNTLKNEYAEFGVELEVVHHTQLLNRLVREGKLTPVAPTNGTEVAGKTITYHDPCFLGRHNQVYAPPRELLELIPGATFAEMPRNSERSFCCGAGGARMWMEETLGSRINVNRTIEAVATGADQIAVGCPFCRVMLSDGLTAQQAAGQAREEVEVLDVAQLLLAAVKRKDEAEVVAEAEAITADAGAAAAAVATDAVEVPEGESVEDVVAALDTPAETTPESDVEVAAEHNVVVEEPVTEEPVTEEPVPTADEELEAAAVADEPIAEVEATESEVESGAAEAEAVAAELAEGEAEAATEAAEVAPAEALVDTTPDEPQLELPADGPEPAELDAREEELQTLPDVDTTIPADDEAELHDWDNQGGPTKDDETS